jgi:hypothetical protein
MSRGREQSQQSRRVGNSSGNSAKCSCCHGEKVKVRLLGLSVFSRRLNHTTLFESWTIRADVYSCATVHKNKVPRKKNLQ